MFELVVLVICILSLGVNLLGSKKRISQSKNYDLKIEIMEKVNETLVKNYDSISSDFSKLYNYNQELISKNENLNIRINKLEMRVETLEDENKKIIKTLEHYNMMAPHFKLDKPFLIKAIK